MYGGGFATMPAYLADIFGTKMVGAIHGRLLTAWSTAGVLGPVLVNYIREYQLAHGVARADAYNQTMYVLAGLLLLGLICNLLVRPCADKHYMGDEEVPAQKHVLVVEVVREDDENEADFEDFVEEDRDFPTAGDEPLAARAARFGGAIAAPCAGLDRRRRATRLGHLDHTAQGWSAISLGDDAPLQRRSKSPDRALLNWLAEVGSIHRNAHNASITTGKPLLVRRVRCVARAT